MNIVKTYIKKKYPQRLVGVYPTKLEVRKEKIHKVLYIIKNNNNKS